MNPSRILVIPLRFIGDTIVTVPLLRNLRHHFPQAQLDVWASRTTAPLLEPCPYLNQVMIEPKGTAARIRQLRDNRYDLVVLLRKSVSMALLCQLAGIPIRVGYDKQRFPWGFKRWGWFLTHRVRYPSLRTEIPQALSHLGLLEPLERAPLDQHLELWSTPADQARVTQILAAHDLDPDRPLAIVHAASASHGKQIEPECFSDGLQHLHQQGYTLVASGIEPDRPLYESIRQHHPGLPLVNLAGRTSLRETVALYQRSQFLLTVDSSPIHIGAAVGIPRIVGVFGPTNERQWGPHNPDICFQAVYRDLPCRPCYAKVCAHNRCRTDITGAQIAQAVQTVLRAPQPSHAPAVRPDPPG